MFLFLFVQYYVIILTFCLTFVGEILQYDTKDAHLLTV